MTPTCKIADIADKVLLLSLHDNKLAHQLKSLATSYNDDNGDQSVLSQRIFWQIRQRQ